MRGDNFCLVHDLAHPLKQGCQLNKGQRLTSLTLADSQWILRAQQIPTYEPVTLVLSQPLTTREVELPLRVLQVCYYDLWEDDT